jgi:hypothetical protein
MYASITKFSFNTAGYYVSNPCPNPLVVVWYKFVLRSHNVICDEQFILLEILSPLPGLYYLYISYPTFRALASLHAGLAANAPLGRLLRSLNTDKPSVEGHGRSECPEREVGRFLISEPRQRLLQKYQNRESERKTRKITYKIMVCPSRANTSPGCKPWVLWIINFMEPCKGDT